MVLILGESTVSPYQLTKFGSQRITAAMAELVIDMPEFPHVGQTFMINVTHVPVVFRVYGGATTIVTINKPSELEIYYTSDNAWRTLVKHAYGAVETDTLNIAGVTVDNIVNTITPPYSSTHLVTEAAVAGYIGGSSTSTSTPTSNTDYDNRIATIVPEEVFEHSLTSYSGDRILVKDRTEFLAAMADGITIELDNNIDLSGSNIEIDNEVRITGKTRNTTLTLGTNHISFNSDCMLDNFTVTSSDTGTSGLILLRGTVSANIDVVSGSRIPYDIQGGSFDLSGSIQTTATSAILVSMPNTGESRIHDMRINCPTDCVRINAALGETLHLRRIQTAIRCDTFLNIPTKQSDATIVVDRCHWQDTDGGIIYSANAMSMSDFSALVITNSTQDTMANIGLFNIGRDYAGAKIESIGACEDAYITKNLTNSGITAGYRSIWQNNTVTYLVSAFASAVSAIFKTLEGESTLPGLTLGNVSVSAIKRVADKTGESTALLTEKGTIDYIGDLTGGAFDTDYHDTAIDAAVGFVPFTATTITTPEEEVADYAAFIAAIAVVGAKRIVLTGNIIIPISRSDAIPLNADTTITADIASRTITYESSSADNEGPMLQIIGTNVTISNLVTVNDNRDGVRTAFEINENKFSSACTLSFGSRGYYSNHGFSEFNISGNMTSSKSDAIFIQTSDIAENCYIHDVLYDGPSSMTGSTIILIENPGSTTAYLKISNVKPVDENKVIGRFFLQDGFAGVTTGYGLIFDDCEFNGEGIELQIASGDDEPLSKFERFVCKNCVSLGSSHNGVVFLTSTDSSKTIGDGSHIYFANNAYPQDLNYPFESLWKDGALTYDATKFDPSEVTVKTGGRGITVPMLEIGSTRITSISTTADEVSPSNAVLLTEKAAVDIFGPKGNTVDANMSEDFEVTSATYAPVPGLNVEVQSTGLYQIYANLSASWSTASGSIAIAERTGEEEPYTYDILPYTRRYYNTENNTIRFDNTIMRVVELSEGDIICVVAQKASGVVTFYGHDPDDEDREHDFSSLLTIVRLR